MARNFNVLKAKMSPERRKRVEARVVGALSEMALADIREAYGLTQTKLANALDLDQGSVSKMERRNDMYISTLREMIEAMGGTLEIRAVFPDRQVRLTQFEDLLRSKYQPD